MLTKNDSFCLDLNADIVAVTGAIDFKTAPAMLHAGQKIIKQTKLTKISFDFSELKSANSAILAVLCAWLRSACAQNIELLFTGFDKKISDLLELCGFNKLYKNIHKG
jgi:anti-anti-sigma factor